jgi:putative flippase GtrA
LGIEIKRRAVVISPKARRFVRNTGVNLAWTVFDFAFILTLTQMFGLPMLQTIIAYTAAMLVNFKLQKSFAFVGRVSPESEHRVFMQFVGTGMIGLASTAGVIWFSLNIMSSFPVVAKTIVAFICFAVLYGARNRLVCKENVISSESVAGGGMSWANIRRLNDVGSEEPSVILSVKVRKPSSVVRSNIVILATFAASHPRARKNLPMRGTLFVSSNVYQWPPPNASNQAPKSQGG